MAREVFEAIAASEVPATLCCTFCQKAVRPATDEVVHMANVIFAHVECATVAPRRRSRRL